MKRPLLFAVYMIACGLWLSTAVDGCITPPKPESVTLVRVDGGFMSCTTFLSAAPDGGSP